MRIKHIRSGERVFLSMFGTIRRGLQEAMQGVDQPEQLLTIAKEYKFDAPIRLAFERIYTSTGVDFARKNSEQYKGKRGKVQRKDLNDELMESVWMRQMLDYVDTKCGAKIQAITRTTYDDIVSVTQRVIERGAEEGWGALRVAREISREQGAIEKWRALRIARTEVVGASNEGAMIGADATGLELRKVWLATTDDRTREMHYEMDNVAVAMNEPFTLPDGTLMDFPGASDAPAEHIINCRCSVAFEPVEDLLEINT